MIGGFKTYLEAKIPKTETLLTGGLYPTIGDSVYVDLNIKYVK